MSKFIFTEEDEQKARADINKIMPGLKDNPHNYVIIQKWNSRIYHKHARELFNYIENFMEGCAPFTDFDELISVKELKKRKEGI